MKKPKRPTGMTKLTQLDKNAAAVVKEVMNIAVAERWCTQLMRLGSGVSFGSSALDCFHASTTTKMSSAPMPAMTKRPSQRRKGNQPRATPDAQTMMVL